MRRSATDCTRPADLLPGSSHYTIQVKLHDEFGDKMRLISEANTGNHLAICLEATKGEFEVLSAPQIYSVFGAEFQITGNFTEIQARTLASQLMNPLENPLVVEQTDVIAAPADAKKP